MITQETTFIAYFIISILSKTLLKIVWRALYSVDHTLKHKTIKYHDQCIRLLQTSEMVVYYIRIIQQWNKTVIQLEWNNFHPILH